MKELYIVRHAKSSWDFPDLPDEERPLLEKGKKRTKLVIDYLLENNISIDLIISSHAVRARETAAILAHALNYPEDNIMISKNVYHGNDESFFNLFYDLSNDIESVMIVGHNPTMTNFANRFLERKIDWLPTSGIVSVKFVTDNWNQVPLANKKVEFLITPKFVKDRNLRKRRSN